MRSYQLKPQTRYFLGARTNAPQIIEVHHANGAVDHLLLPFDALAKFTITPLEHAADLYGSDINLRPQRQIFGGETAQDEALRIFYQSRFAAPLRFGGCIYSCQRPRKGAARQSLADNRGMDLGSESLATLMSSAMICDPVPDFQKGGAGYGGALRLGVVLHLHYAELWPEFAAFFAQCLPDFKLVVTLTAPDPDLEASILAQFPSALVRVVDNLGRDIWPFLQVLAAGDLGDVDLICKLHGKRSVLSGVTGGRFGHLWRRRNLLDLLGSPSQVQNILGQFEMRPQLGMMGSAALRLRNSGGIDPGFEASLETRTALCAQAGLDPGCIADDFFAGTMFWVRRAALEPLTKIPFETPMFTDETAQLGDQFEHGIERFFGDCVRACGYGLGDIEPLALVKPVQRSRALAPHGLFLGRSDSFGARWQVALPGDLAGKHVAMVAVTAPDGNVPAHTRYLLEHLKGAGYLTVLCGASAHSAAIAAAADAVFWREIGGYDMALWGAALRDAPQLWGADALLFATDAVLGPLDDPALGFADFKDGGADCRLGFGGKERTFSRHLFALYPKALAHEEVRAHFETALSWTKERESIYRYEARFLELLEETCGLRVDVVSDIGAFMTIYDVVDHDLSVWQADRLRHYLSLLDVDTAQFEREIWARARDLLLDHGVQSQLAMDHKAQIRAATKPRGLGALLNKLHPTQ